MLRIPVFSLPSGPLRKKIDNNKITLIMIKSLFTNSDYNKRFLKILKITKLRDVKNGSEYIGKKGNPIYNDIKKKYEFIKIRITL